MTTEQRLSLEGVADFLSNGRDNLDNIEAATYLVKEFDFSTVNAIQLVAAFDKEFVLQHNISTMDYVCDFVQKYAPLSMRS